MDFTDVIAGRTTLAQAVVRHPLYPNLYLLTAPVSSSVFLPSCASAMPVSVVNEVFPVPPLPDTTAMT